MKKLTKKQKKNKKKNKSSNFLTRIKESRAKIGLGKGNKDHWRSTTIKPNQAKGLYESLTYFNVLKDKVDQISEALGGLPEKLDKESINLSGLNLRTFIETSGELAFRYYLYEGGVIDNPFDYYDTIGVEGGKKEKIYHISEESHDQFIYHWEILKEHDPKAIEVFTKHILEIETEADI